jgi:hypothetical protein
LFSWRGVLTSFKPQEENIKQRVAEIAKIWKEIKAFPLQRPLVHFISIIFWQKYEF